METLHFNQLCMDDTMEEKVALYTKIGRTYKPGSQSPVKVAVYAHQAHKSDINTPCDENEFYSTWAVKENFMDIGKSSTSTKDRPAFHEMINRCQKGEVDLIVTQSTFKFLRNTSDLAYYINLLNELRIPIIFESENIIFNVDMDTQSESPAISPEFCLGLGE